MKINVFSPKQEGRGAGQKAHTHKHTYKPTRVRVHYAKIYQCMKFEVSFLDSLTIKGRAFATSMRLEKLL